MSTLAEIKAAVDSLPPEQKEELLRFLAEGLRGRANDVAPLTVASSKSGFLFPKDAITLPQRTLLKSN